MTRALLLTMGLLAFTAHSAFAGAFETNGFIREVAGKLQMHLPKMAADGLFEAHRSRAGWTYSIFTRVGKTSCDVVKIEIEQINAYRSRATVTTVRVEGGVLGRFTVRTPEQTPPWEAKIRLALR